MDQTNNLLKAISILIAVNSGILLVLLHEIIDAIKGIPGWKPYKKPTEEDNEKSKN